MQCQCDVLIASDASDQPRSSMQNRLKSSDDAVRDTIAKSVAVVNAACDERMDRGCSAS